MKRSLRYIWIIRFLCVLFCVLAVLFARYEERISRQNELAVLEAERTASKIAASLFVWEKTKAQELRELAAKMVLSDDVLTDAGSFKALFIADADGAVLTSTPADYLKDTAGLWKVTRDQWLDIATVFLPEPLQQPALAMIYEKEDERRVLYALLRSEDLMPFFEQGKGLLVTILDGNENVIITNNEILKSGMNRLTEMGNSYASLGGGFYRSSGESPNLAYRVNSKGAFGWIVFVEVTLQVWQYGEIPSDICLTFSAGFLALSLWLGFMRKRRAIDENSTREARVQEKAGELKKRMKNIVEKDRQ